MNRACAARRARPTEQQRLRKQHEARRLAVHERVQGTERRVGRRKVEKDRGSKGGGGTRAGVCVWGEGEDEGRELKREGSFKGDEHARGGGLRLRRRCG